MNSLNKIIILIIFVIFYSYSFSSLNPDENEYSHNAITPGYDISDYFVLTPSTLNHREYSSPKNIPTGTFKKILLKKENRFQYTLEVHNLEKGKTLTVKIVGLNGRIFSSQFKKIRDPLTKLKIKIDRSYSSGMYIIYISTSSYQESIKFPLFQ